jgi:hypothetical protein
MEQEYGGAFESRYRRAANLIHYRLCKLKARNGIPNRRLRTDW